MLRPNAPPRVCLIGLALATSSATSNLALAAAAVAPSPPTQWTTEEAPQVVDLRDGVKLMLAADTKLLQLPSIPTPVHAKNIAPRAYSLELVRGRVDIEIDSSKQPYYTVMIHAPRRVAAYLKGGHSTVVASEQGVAVVAFSGIDVIGGAADKWRPVHVGTALVISREHPAGDTRTVLAAPTLQVNHSLNLNIGDQQPTILTWTKVPESRRYNVSLVNATESTGIALQSFRSTAPSFTLPPLKPGLYHATVSATDDWQIDSPQSNPVAIRVVGMQLPEGAYVRAGVPQLGELQAIRLTNTDGLEMAYGSGSLFQLAPDSMRLLNGRPQLVRLREARSTQEVTLRLEPRGLAGNIQFTPSRAQWPGVPISAKVNISGPDGSPLPQSVNVSLKTSINSEAVDVDWSRTGNTWAARIRQPTMAGPWILRVTASDQAGQILARDFIEVGLPSKPPGPSPANRYSDDNAVRGSQD